ncbi:MAG: transporter, family, multidrug resistance protein [Mycobacterium sp.]|jgi:ACDE family multidrug resistance protein|nr:transporter, family, multidrug resistance protein [Mycobacterium sp.]
MTRSTQRTRRPVRAGAVVWVASLTAGLITSGMQGIVPAIPAIRDHFGLSNFQVGLITSVYLLPGVFSAFAAGVLTERIGSRKVVAGGLMIFGLGGALLLVVHDLGTLLGVRFVQGIVFGALLSMTVGLIGSVARSGQTAHRAQSRRIVGMAAGETLFPIAGGMLLAIAWYAPFAMQIFTVPLAVVAWLVLPDDQHQLRREAKEAPPESIWKAPAVVGVQILAAGRFIFKFAVLTYVPVLAVDQVGVSPAVLGWLVGASGALAVVTALLSERLASKLRSSEMIIACMLVITVSLVLIGLGSAAVVMAIGLLLYGIQDGVYGVAHNVLANEMAPQGSRMAYVGLTGTTRNIGKFAAPLVFGAATLVLSIPSTFFAFAGVGVLGAAVACNVARKQRALESAADRPTRAKDQPLTTTKRSAKPEPN